MYLSLMDLMRQMGGFPLLDAAAPQIEVEEQGAALYCRARLPGIDPRSVQVQVRETSLALAGFGTREERTQGPNFVRTQSAVHRFYREVPLPTRVDPHRATMQWQDHDLLVVICPKRWD